MPVAGTRGSGVLEKVAKVDNELARKRTPKAGRVPDLVESLRVGEDLYAYIRCGLPERSNAKSMPVPKVIGIVFHEKPLEEAARVYLDSPAPEHKLTARKRTIGYLPLILFLFARIVRARNQCGAIVQIPFENRTGSDLK